MSKKEYLWVPVGGTYSGNPGGNWITKYERDFICYQYTWYTWNNDSKKLKEDWTKYINLYSKEEKGLTKEMRQNAKGGEGSTWTSTGLWPVRNQAMQQEVSEVSFVFAAALQH